MISAKLSYRSYVSIGTIAITFADLKFFGNDKLVERLSNLTHYVKYERLYKMEKKLTAKKNML